ncbi:ABC transporter substrate-binding protein [Prosthecomicrobium sp. N25]|uniref:ABC transporter substrate-binding protein n=1 Tax=Prosthecomicrobium sp. N25 TaxID=3129254 RepID=UPI003076FF33
MLDPMAALRRAVAGATLVGLAAAAPAPAAAQGKFLDVGKQAPITILINASPWYAGFEKAVDLYVKQTGNEVNLDVTPYGGMLEKARNAVRGSTSPYDILNLDSGWTIEFYEAGFLKPLGEIDASIKLPEEVLECGNTFWWNADKRYRTPAGGKLMGVPPNCNIHIVAYRADLFKQAGIEAPKTYDDVLAACKKVQNPPGLYGFVTRGERGNGIRYDFSTFMLGHGVDVVADASGGDYTVTMNSPKVLAALNQFITLMKTCAPTNAGSLGQADVIQLMSSGKAAMVQTVIAAWGNYEDKTKSAVAGKVAAAPVPQAVPGQKAGVAIGNWNFTVPKNTPADRQKAAVAFMKWFLTGEAQRAYAEAGGIPVRVDTLKSDLAQKPQFSWMPAYLASIEIGQPTLGFAESAEVEQVMGLRLNQALIGELAPAKALNLAADEIAAIFTRTGRKTGKLPPLPE